MTKFITILFAVPVIYSSSLDAQNQTLPVELYYFNYQVIDSGVELDWGTETETNFYGFNVERYFNSEWENLHFERAYGTSNSPKDYSYVDTAASPGAVYLYRLQQVDNDGTYKYSDTLTVSLVTDISKQEKSIHDNFRVSQNFPNPFNPSTSIMIDLPKSGDIELKIFNALGNVVYAKNYGDRTAGSFVINFNASHLSSGVYYYSITSGEYRLTKSMLYLK